MEYFLIEGLVTNPEKMSDDLMSEHQAYTGQLMARGNVLFSSLKSDMSASITVVKAESETAIRHFYDQEPFFVHGVITYTISKLDIHYHTKSEDWFKN